MINNLTILRTVKRNLPTFTIPHPLNRILQILFIFLIPAIILVIGSLILAKPVELPQDDTTISEVAVIQNSNPSSDTANQSDEGANIELSEATSNTKSPFGPVKGEPAIVMMTLNDDGTAASCVIIDEKEKNTSYLPIEASYRSSQMDNLPEYDPVGAELQQVMAGDTSSYLTDPMAQIESEQAQFEALQAELHKYSTDPFELLAEAGGEQFIPDPLKPSNQNNPVDQPQLVGNYQPTNQAVNPVQYHYNGDGHLVGKTVDGVRTDFALDIANGLPEVIYTSDGNSYLHLPGVIVTENAEGEVRYLLSDGLGTIRQAVDETGQVVASYEFDSYGNPVNGSGGDPYGYTGEWWENDVGLLHLRARWYMPETGTFLSQDPIEGEPPYVYAGGNPVNVTDPTGMWRWRVSSSSIYHDIVENH